MAVTELEWLNQNRHRNYPLADDASGVSTNGKALPTSFLCDMAIDVPPLDAFNSGYFYISEITNLGETFQLCVSHSEVSAVLLRSIPISYNFIASDSDVESSRMPLYVTQEALQLDSLLEQASGEIIIGSCSDMYEVAGATFENTAGKLNPFVARKGFAGLSRIIVVDSDGVEHRVTGDLTLESEHGIGIALDVDPNTGERKIVLSEVELTEQEQAGENTEYRTLDDVLAALYKLLGVPITSINGIGPDEDGNFNISGLDCTDVNGINNGITISNPCAKPCCTSDIPADIATALSSLEEARNRLINYHEALLNNLQTMQSRLASLIASKG